MPTSYRYIAFREDDPHRISSADQQNRIIVIIVVVIAVRLGSEACTGTFCGPNRFSAVYSMSLHQRHTVAKYTVPQRFYYCADLQWMRCAKICDGERVVAANTMMIMMMMMNVRQNCEIVCYVMYVYKLRCGRDCFAERHINYSSQHVVHLFRQRQSVSFQQIIRSIQNFAVISINKLLIKKYPCSIQIPTNPLNSHKIHTQRIASP